MMENQKDTKKGRNANGVYSYFKGQGSLVGRLNMGRSGVILFTA